MEDNKPTLTVIKGGREAGEGRGTRRSGKTPSGLTVKQEAFVRGLVDGLSNADSYRQAYDASAMKPGTLHNEASKLAVRPDIAKRVAELLGEKRVKHGMLSEKQADRVWRNVWRLAEGGNDVPPAVQQSAIALAAKMAGMLTDKVEVKTETSDSKSIEAELLQRLQRLSG